MVYREIQENEIIVFGKFGQVAQHLAQIMPYARFISSAECNFTHIQELESFLLSLQPKPKVIINTTGYTKVDLAEKEQYKAELINAMAVKVLGNYCKDNNILLIHYSTDYVFDGLIDTEYTEDNIRNLSPLSIYGKTKLTGDQNIVQSKCNYYIIRTSWVYSEYGNNFVKTMLNLMQQKKKLSIVNDQYGSPTYADNIAKITKMLLQKQPQYGIYNLTDSGFTTWFDFANKIHNIATDLNYKITTEELIPVTTEQFGSIAPRPKFSKLNKKKAEDALGIKLENWQTALSRCMKHIIAQKD